MSEKTRLSVNIPSSLDAKIETLKQRLGGLNKTSVVILALNELYESKASDKGRVHK
ncbi:MAG: hypothetical protein ABF480_11850 [Lacticaseibacillus paracasei]